MAASCSYYKGEKQYCSSYTTPSNGDYFDDDLGFQTQLYTTPVCESNSIDTRTKTATSCSEYTGGWQAIEGGSIELSNCDMATRHCDSATISSLDPVTYMDIYVPFNDCDIMTHTCSSCSSGDCSSYQVTVEENGQQVTKYRY